MERLIEIASISGTAVDFLTRFRSAHGRSPRVLHIGNIANNAYLNAKLLNDLGFDCDVICYDYYHIMGCPEWEDGLFDGAYGDQFKPDWNAAGVRGFERPEWFVQGALRTCIDYLDAKRSGNEKKRKEISILLRRGGAAKSSVRERISTTKRRLSYLFDRVYQFVLASPKVVTRIARLCDEGRIAAFVRREIFRVTIAWFLTTVVLVTRLVLQPILLVSRYLSACLPSSFKKDDVACNFDIRVNELITLFSERFPQRKDALHSEDLEWFRCVYPSWRRLLKHYDLVHAYSTDPIIPLLVDVPYVAFEHGTIRNIPFESTPQGRMCAISYRCSNWAVITNADNLSSARRLGLERFTFVPHPVNENGVANSSEAEKLRHELTSRLGASFLVFHPSRQHWSSARHPDWEKGNDIFLRGFARFVHQVNGEAAAVLVEWGAMVEDSRRLITELGIEDKVLWVQPMPHLRMIEYIKACDLVADQFFLGAFGSTLPKALACGRPAMLFLDEAIHQECFKEMPPVLNAKTEGQVFEQLLQLQSNPTWGDDLRLAGRRWYQQYHSNGAIANYLAHIYGAVLGTCDLATPVETAICAA